MNSIAGRGEGGGGWGKSLYSFATAARQDQSYSSVGK